MVAFRYIHYLHDLFDRHCLVCIYGECRILFSLQFLYQRVFNPVESYRGLVSVDMIGERVRVTVMLDRDADRSFCGYLSRTFRKQKLQCRRNTMSVIDDIEKLESTFVVLLIAIVCDVILQPVREAYP